jgi:hypothetical protein
MGLTTPNIITTEYGSPISVPVEEIDRLGLFDALEELAANKIIQLSCYGPLVVVQAGKYVGKATSRLGSFMIEPRYPSLFEEMLSTIQRASKSVLTDFRVNDEAAASKLRPETVYQKYARLLSEFVCQGLPFSYQREIRRTCFPTTGIDMSRTIALLRARGQSHEVFCSAHVRLLDIGLKGLLEEAASVSESSGDLSGHLLRDLELCIRVIGQETLLSKDECIAAADLLIGDPAYDCLKPLIQAARDVLTAIRVSPTLSIITRSATSDFFALDQLWEQFLHILLRDLLMLRVQLHPYRGLQTPLFKDGGPDVDPDIAIFRRDMVETIIDAKYTLSMSASAEHVYQIMAYTDCLDAKVGVLAYLSPGTPWKQFVGTTNRGARLWAVGVSLSRASADVREFLGPLVNSSGTEVCYGLN